MSKMRPTTTASLVRAFFEEWAEVGYAALRLERVARRAGAGKSAIYRRWGSKLEMARECLPAAALTITDVTCGDSLDEDLRSQLRLLRRVLRHRLIRRIAPDIFAEVSRGSELSEAIRPFQAARRQRFKAVLDRAVARGELSPTIDRETACDLIAAGVFWRLIVVGDAGDTAYIERLTASLSAAVRALQG